VSARSVRWLVRAAAVAAAVLLAAAATNALPLVPALALGLALAVLFAGEAWLAVVAGAARPRRAGARQALLDTSVLIDGRIQEVAESGFLAFDLVVPEFVLRELQHVADSADAGRRARGRRGLDVLQALSVVPDDVPAEREVDQKLVVLARTLKAALLTNDFNLNKVAAIQGVPVLNVNDLARSLRPAWLPGDALQVTIVKEGREAGQGVGYLEDGTMVVVDQARDLLGETVEIVVTSALQTAAGKMFFAKRAV